MSSEHTLEGTLRSLAKSIETSKHKDLLCEGFVLFSHFLEGKPLQTERLVEPLQKSAKVLGEDLEKQMISMADDNEEDLRLQRFVGKCLKKELLALVGEHLTEEEQEVWKEDKKYLVEALIQNFDLL